MSLDVKIPIKNSIVGEKAYEFALQIISLYKDLSAKREFILSKQLLRSGTSIGANVNEAQAAVSKRDFIYKLSISLKEARETNYWLSLLHDSDYINETDFEKLENNCTGLVKMLTSIIVTTKKKYLEEN